MKWFQNFMRGRYGVDQLSFAILVLYFIVTMIGMIMQNSMITYLSTILIVWCWFRILSRKTYKRSAENTLYLQKTYPIRMWFRKKKTVFRIVRHISIINVLVVNRNYGYQKVRAKLQLLVQNVIQNLINEHKMCKG